MCRTVMPVVLSKHMELHMIAMLCIKAHEFDKWFSAMMDCLPHLSSFSMLWETNNYIGLAFLKSRWWALVETDKVATNRLCGYLVLVQK